VTEQGENGRKGRALGCPRSQHGFDPYTEILRLADTEMNARPAFVDFGSYCLHSPKMKGLSVNDDHSQLIKQ
jgi:hypothetical protein